MSRQSSADEPPITDLKDSTGPLTPSSQLIQTAESETPTSASETHLPESASLPNEPAASEPGSTPPQPESQPELQTTPGEQVQYRAM